MSSNKVKTVYRCSACGAEHGKWQGSCSQCKEFNTLEETTAIVVKKSGSGSNWAGQSKGAVRLGDVKKKGPLKRLDTGVPLLNKLLGGGLVSDSVVLLSGDPGIGKSTISLQVALDISQNHTVLYVTGEESEDQVADRARRIGHGADNLLLMAASNLEEILGTIQGERPAVTIIDSIQAIASSNHDGAPGAVGQLKECAAQLNRMAKTEHTSIIMIGHVTKDGQTAGPKSMEHLVDVVLHFEGDDREGLRLLRSIKNRFGASRELEAFTMDEKGLTPVPDISTLFLPENLQQEIGSAIFGQQEGHKTMLLEIQALIDPSSSATTKIMPIDINYYRLAMVLAVMQKSLGIDIGGYPVFASVSGGIKVEDPSADLALAAAILSSWQQRALPNRTIVLGELSLTGQVRPVRQIAQRLKDAKQVGMREVWLPANQQHLAGEGWVVRPMKNITDLADLLREQPQKSGATTPQKPAQKTGRDFKKNKNQPIERRGDEGEVIQAD